MEQEIIDLNMLMAQFMGFKDTKRDNWNRWAIPKKYQRVYGETSELLCFDTSWDWLMLVVEKIEEIKGVNVTIYTAWKGIGKKFGSGCGITITTGKRKYSEAICHEEKIMAVYLSAIAFIKWYNETKSTN